MYDFGRLRVDVDGYLERAIIRIRRHLGLTLHRFLENRDIKILIDVEDVALGHETRTRWNDTSAWVWSEQLVHEPLISTETFETAQAMFDRTKRATTRTPSEGRRYLLAGIVRCGIWIMMRRDASVIATTPATTASISSPRMRSENSPRAPVLTNWNVCTIPGQNR